MTCRAVPDIDVVVFDKGGVLTRSSFAQMQQDFAEALGLPIERVRSHFRDHYADVERGDLSEQDFVAGFATGTTCDTDSLKPDLLIKSYSRKEKRIEHTWQMVHRLRQNGVRVGLLSNTIPSHARISERRGIYQGFEPLLLSCRLGLRKPESAIWRCVVEHTGVAANRIGFVDDSQEMVAGARAYGLRAVHYRDPQSLDDALNQWRVL